MTPSEDRRQAARRESDEPAKDWRGYVMAALWMVLFAVVGFLGNKVTTKQEEQDKELHALITRQAVYEYEAKATTDRTIRIEAMVQELLILRQQERQERKR